MWRLDTSLPVYSYVALCLIRGRLLVSCRTGVYCTSPICQLSATLPTHVQNPTLPNSMGRDHKENIFSDCLHRNDVTRFSHKRIISHSKRMRIVVPGQKLLVVSITARRETGSHPSSHGTCNRADDGVKSSARETAKQNNLTLGEHRARSPFLLLRNGSQCTRRHLHPAIRRPRRASSHP
jgi:hypothetical protein